MKKWQLTERGSYFLEQLARIKDNSALDDDVRKLANLVGEHIFGPIMDIDQQLWYEVEVRPKVSRRATKKLHVNRRKSVKRRNNA